MLSQGVKVPTAAALREPVPSAPGFVQLTPVDLLFQVTCDSIHDSINWWTMGQFEGSPSLATYSVKLAVTMVEPSGIWLAPLPKMFGNFRTPCAWGPALSMRKRGLVP